MALGGGTFLVQNKVLPGAYINFVSVAKASATLSDRGFATMPIEFGWGPEGKMFTVEQGEFLKDSMEIFGYAYTADELLPMREIFAHAQTVHFYRLNTGKKAGAEGAGLKVTAKYSGERGNALSYSVEKNEDGTFNVILRMGNSIVSTYSNLANAEALYTVEDPYVVFATPVSENPAENVVKVKEPDEKDDLLGKHAGDLQEGITMETDGTTAYVSGTLKYVTGYTGFNGKNKDLQKGNYFTVKIAENSYSKWQLTKNGEKTGKEMDYDMNGDFAIFHVEPGETFGITVKNNSDPEKIINFDFSRASFEQEDGTLLRQGDPLTAAAMVPLTGGSSDEVQDDAYQNYLDAAESYSFNAMACPSTDEKIKMLFEQNCERMRDDVGKKFQVVVFNDLADYEGVVSVKNGLEGDTENPALIPWVTGVVAGTAVNASATNMTYDGEYTIDTAYTQTELENGIREGSFMFHRVDDAVNVLTDINTFVSVTDVKSADFSSNQTIRVLDQIANDIAVLFGQKYIGKVPNDNAGRVSLWSDIVKHHEQLQTIRAIENFSGENVTVEPGDTKKAVVVTDYVTPVNAMEQLYMTVYVS